MASSAFTDIRALQDEINKQDAEIASILKELGVQLGSASQPALIWLCPKCKELNVEGDAPLSACELCDQPKPSAAAPKVTANFNQASVAQTSTFKPIGWKCHACGTHNDESVYECNVCYADEEDGGAPARPGCGYRTALG